MKKTPNMESDDKMKIQHHKERQTWIHLIAQGLEKSDDKCYGFL
jgi:hypothetical protein